VVHPHLKFVLLVQSGFAVLGALTHLINLILSILHDDPIWLNTPVLMSSFLSFDVQFFAMIGHVLLVERVLATVWASRYEHWRSRWFSGGWFIILVSVSVYSVVEFIHLCIIIFSKSNIFRWDYNYSAYWFISYYYLNNFIPRNCVTDNLWIIDRHQS
jgi:hypothetical protein